jgi:hypothetical protein
LSQIFVAVLVLSKSGKKLRSHSILKFLIAFFTIITVFSVIHFREELHQYLNLASPAPQDKWNLALSGAIPLGLNLFLTVVVWTTPFDIDWKPVMETGLGYCSVR